MQSKSITLFYLSHGPCRGSSATPGLTVTFLQAAASFDGYYKMAGISIPPR